MTYSHAKTWKKLQNRRLQCWLTDYEYAQIDVEWEEKKSFRDELKDKPSELKRYEGKLKAATFE